MPLEITRVFSAKEAFSKAVGMGMRMPMTWRSCEIANLPSGKPTIVLHGANDTNVPVVEAEQVVETAARFRPHADEI